MIESKEVQSLFIRFGYKKTVKGKLKLINNGHYGQQKYMVLNCFGLWLIWTTGSSENMDKTRFSFLIQVYIKNHLINWSFEKKSFVKQSQM